MTIRASLSLPEVLTQQHANWARRLALLGYTAAVRPGQHVSAVAHEMSRPIATLEDELITTPPSAELLACQDRWSIVVLEVSEGPAEFSAAIVSTAKGRRPIADRLSAKCKGNSFVVCFAFIKPIAASLDRNELSWYLSR